MPGIAGRRYGKRTFGAWTGPRAAPVLLAVALTALPAGVPAEAPQKLPLLDKARATAMARQVLTALPKPPRGWRVGRGAIFGAQATVQDQGPGHTWRYLPTANRTYLRGRGAKAPQLRVRVMLVPLGWIREKRRQMSRMEERAGHCVTRPKIAGSEAWLLGWFDIAARRRTPEGGACVPGARLVIFHRQFIVTLSTGHNIGAAGLRVARGIDYAALAEVQAQLRAARGEKK